MAFPIKTAEYQALTEIVGGAWGLAYGPVQSRRLGASLGVNLLGAEKACSFDCPYCELGESTLRMNQMRDEERFPNVTEIDEAVRGLIRAELKKNVKIDHITVSGNGEPTLHPFFFEVVEALLKVRADLVPESKLVALTNGAHFDNRKVIDGLNLLDDRMVKLDAGSDTAFKRVNRPLIRGSVLKVSSGARKLKDLIVQSMFVQGSVDNTSHEDIEDWLEIVGILKPKQIQLTTIARVPATSGITKASEDTLYTIASKVKRKLQIDCLVFP